MGIIESIRRRLTGRVRAVPLGRTEMSTYKGIPMSSVIIRHPSHALASSAETCSAPAPKASACETDGGGDGGGGGGE